MVNSYQQSFNYLSVWLMHKEIIRLAFSYLIYYEIKYQKKSECGQDLLIKWHLKKISLKKGKNKVSIHSEAANHLFSCTKPRL